ncbi:MAG: Flp pilus assembly protein CpaB [Ignavibacteriales bacterium]
MRVGTIVSLGASAVLGLGALVVAKVWLPSTGKHEKPVETVPVVAAAKPLAFGTKLDEKSLVVLQLPASAAPVGAYRSIKDVIKLDAGGAPVALVPIAAREVLLPAKLSGAGARPSVAAMITPGMRAYTITVSDQAGGGGHVLPGDRVDIVLTRQIPGGGDQNVESDVVLQDVRILGMNMNSDQQSTDKASPHTATLEVSPDDAARLALAAKVGDLSLALRRTGAVEVAPARVLRVSDLGPFSAARVQNSTAGYQPAAVPPPPAPPTTTQASARKRPSGGGLIVVNGNERSDANSGAGA